VFEPDDCRTSPPDSRPPYIAIDQEPLHVSDREEFDGSSSDQTEKLPKRSLKTADKRRKIRKVIYSDNCFATCLTFSLRFAAKLHSLI
jgi:hypothetical protein